MGTGGLIRTPSLDCDVEHSDNSFLIHRSASACGDRIMLRQYYNWENFLTPPEADLILGKTNEGDAPIGSLPGGANTHSTIGDFVISQSQLM